MGCPYAYGTQLLNFKFIRDLNCSWIKEHLYQHKIARFLSPCTSYHLSEHGRWLSYPDQIINREATQEEA